MICLICARSGSKGLPNKNIKKIDGKTLLAITIQLAKEVKEIKKVIVSTDSKTYARIAKNEGATVPFIRPKFLALDHTNEWDVWKHAIKHTEKILNFEDVIVLPVVSPLRTKNDIIKIIKEYKKNKKKAVVTITESSNNPFYNMVYLDKNKNIKKLKYKKKLFRRQEAPKFFDVRTVGYMLHKNTIKQKKNIFDCNLSYVKIPKARALDIDDKYDFMISKILYEKTKKKKTINFKNKYILITGSAGFIGSSLASHFFNQGANLILTDKIKKPEKLKKILNKNKVNYIYCDLNSISSIKNLQKIIIKSVPRLDVIIHNASSTGDDNIKGWADNFKNQLTEHWDKVFQVSLKANFEINKSFVKLLKKSTNPSIINIASIYGFMAPDWKIYKGDNIKNPAGYGVSKAGLIYMTKWLAKILGPKIRVNSISPGGLIRNQSNRFIKKYVEKVPLSRMANEQDVVNSVIFLASDMSNYITGQNIVVDGGISL